MTEPDPPDLLAHIRPGPEFRKSIELLPTVPIRSRGKSWFGMDFAKLADIGLAELRADDAAMQDMYNRMRLHAHQISALNATVAMTNASPPCEQFARRGPKMPPISIWVDELAEPRLVENLVAPPGARRTAVNEAAQNHITSLRQGGLGRYLHELDVFRQNGVI